MNLLQGPSLGKNITMYLVNEEKFKTFKVFLSALLCIEWTAVMSLFTFEVCDVKHEGRRKKKFNLLQKFIIWIAKAYLKKKMKIV